MRYLSTILFATLFGCEQVQTDNEIITEATDFETTEDEQSTEESEDETVPGVDDSQQEISNSDSNQRLCDGHFISEYGIEEMLKLTELS